MSLTEGNHRYILGMRVDAVTYDSVTAQAMKWSKEAETSRYICIANVHMTMETKDDPAYREVVNGADIVTPDGMPLVWGLKALGIPSAERVYGPILQLHLMTAAAKHGVPVGLYGGAPDVLKAYEALARDTYPGLEVAYAYSPPYRPLSTEEQSNIVRDINASGAKLILVGLGCPKQERWMAAHKGKINAVMVGVGAGFDFFTGAKPQAPHALQRMGLEWAFRLATEPKRLAPRYLKHNPRFVAQFLRQLYQHVMRSSL